jgi:hypothetical protein
VGHRVLLLGMVMEPRLCRWCRRFCGLGGDGHSAMHDRCNPGVAVDTRMLHVLATVLPGGTVVNGRSKKPPGKRWYPDSLWNGDSSGMAKKLSLMVGTVVSFAILFNV